MDLRAPTRRAVAAVIGPRAATPRALELAQGLGRDLVDAGFRVATGGLGGVMEAASRGARDAAAWREGRVLGILPGSDADAANPFVDIALPSSMGVARNVLLMAMADVVVAVSGGAGTLSELAMAWQLERPIIALDVVEGWSRELAGRALDGRRADRIHAASEVEAAVAIARRLVLATGRRHLDAPPPA